jgi:hypothetical protein
MSTPKEPGYFAPDVPGTRPEQRFRFPDDESAYLSLFEHARSATRLGESSTNYLMSHHAPPLIREYQPEAQIIAMVRNPVDLVHSLHGQRMASGEEPIADFESAIDADDDRRQDRRLPDRLHGFGVAYRDNAMLGEQLERWLDVFGSDRVHVIVYDDFARDTAVVFRSVLAFLRVDDDFRPEAFDVYNPSHRRRGGLLHLLYRNDLTRWVSRSSLPGTIGEHATGRLRDVLGMRRVTRRRHQRAPIQPALRRRLEGEFASDVEKLSRLLGRDLVAEWFGRTPAATTTRPRSG